jgi:hypothetical protein
MKVPFFQGQIIHHACPPHRNMMAGENEHENNTDVRELFF